MILFQNLDGYGVKGGGLENKTEEQWDTGMCERSKMGVGLERVHGVFEELRENDKVAGLGKMESSG